MTMVDDARLHPKLVTAQHVDLGQPWPAASDVQRLRGNPDGSGNGASLKMQHSLSVQMRMVARSVLMHKQAASRHRAGDAATKPAQPDTTSEPGSPATPRSPRSDSEWLLPY
jgi:hypothetical protein